ncbi:Cytochrome P450 2D11 [Bagarius yarrelli]|uniref:Cytochrome P450 2D11 n=1 Tax=Bagarius yarrelli TaxID=175774 RepID=A0A556UY38_BAGYA|nr:Cytochrome P450 2D11 [Bagarius yarrelli]
MADYGPGWRAHRRFDLMTLRNFGMGKQSMETRILAEIEHMVARLEKNVGSTMNPQTLFHDAASNIIYLVLISTRYDYEDKTLKEYVRMFVQITKMLNGPWGMGIDGSSFNEMQLVMHLLDLHVAGTDTTANTLLTAFLYLITHPDVQEKCQQEIDEVLDGKVHVSFEDRHNMPYTQAVIHECQRVARTGTLIITDLSSVLSEEGQWKFFLRNLTPSNFLNEQGQFEKPEAFLPFSAGPRMCLGEGLARMELFLILVTLLRHFQFVWPDNAGTPDFTPVYGITLTPKPYEMGIKLRRTAQEMQK